MNYKKSCEYIGCGYNKDRKCTRPGGDCFMYFMNPNKPPLGCKPYYVAISERMSELCEAIDRNASEEERHNQTRLWITELHMLNEMDRMLRRVEKENVYVEDDTGGMKEVK